ncbi:Oidioi.mRNA.OKI2018_I69.XSR.g15546.t1.cds [Oikopleura dioica]|uniref:Oidioi.mRNA.OKI2018_I69.XSR.g15546.t1.cds n=1 Tax=Oikopleura dioica TaxID=34765 RepID=A0ABN7SD73_OIKDI|nr:Oidioi.mRNA.OKI2018_I69.XSR.g15546.t1.cds [Oikopleura dioica]
MHPADIAGAQRKLEVEKAKAEGTYKRDIIRARAPKTNEDILKQKRKKVEEDEANEESPTSSESDEEIEIDDRVGKDELFDLLKRRKEDDDESESEEPDFSEDEEDEDQVDDEVIEAENTWHTHLNTDLTGKQIESVSNKKSYDTKKISLNVYKHTTLKAPRNIDLPDVKCFDDPSTLHIRDRIQRNMRKMDDRERDLFSLFINTKMYTAPLPVEKFYLLTFCTS